MHIFIDESGVFANPDDKDEAISVVGALSVPSKQLDSLDKKFEKLKTKLNISDTEVKGSKLSEAQNAQFLNLLKDHDACAKLIFIDLGLHKDADIEKHRSDQADLLTASLTPQSSSTLRSELEDAQNRLKTLSSPLYVQFILLTELVCYALQNFTIWHAFRDGSELEKLSWVVDAKDNNITNYEELWQLLIPAFIQSRFLKDSFKTVEGGDYKAFERFKSKLQERPEWFPKDQGDINESGNFYDPKMMIKEDFKLLQSDSIPGLQLVDIVVTTLRRALTGTIKFPGWMPLSNILICEKASTVTCLGLYSSSGSTPKRIYSYIINWLHQNSCSMFPSKDKP